MNLDLKVSSGTISRIYESSSGTISSGSFLIGVYERIDPSRSSLLSACNFSGEFQTITDTRSSLSVTPVGNFVPSKRKPGLTPMIFPFRETCRCAYFPSESLLGGRTESQYFHSLFVKLISLTSLRESLLGAFYLVSSFFDAQQTHVMQQTIMSARPPTTAKVRSPLSSSGELFSASNCCYATRAS